jgi:hypothetical protein
MVAFGSKPGVAGGALSVNGVPSSKQKLSDASV